MTEDDIRSWFQGLSTGNVIPLTSGLAETCVLEFPGTAFGGTVVGARRIRVFLRQNQRLFEVGPTFTVHWAGVVGNKGIAQWTNAGRTKTGIDYANRGVTVFTREGDKISRIEDYLDTEKLAETWPQ